MGIGPYSLRPRRARDRKAGWHLFYKGNHNRLSSLIFQIPSEKRLRIRPHSKHEKNCHNLRILSRRVRGTYSGGIRDPASHIDLLE